jgi:predicted O-linked N-acetylglucosamine transferase (SPINDLY family)
LQNTDQGLQDKRGQKAKNDEFMDEYALALCSLQDNCHWDLFERHLPYGISLLRHQIREQKDPSMGPFHILNVLGMENASELDLDLFNQASEQYALHARKNAKPNQSGKNPFSQTRTVSTGLDSTTSKGRKVTYVTADMRRSPWWQLSKVQLLEWAQRNTLFIYSRPLIQLDGDPYYEALKKMCTIIEFKEETSDAEVAKCIIGDSPDVVLDAGGPTYGSFTGVMALLPRHILRGAHLGFPGTQPGGHIDFSIVDQFVMTPGCAQAEGADEAFMFLSCYQPNDS